MSIDKWNKKEKMSRNRNYIFFIFTQREKHVDPRKSKNYFKRFQTRKQFPQKPRAKN